VLEQLVDALESDPARPVSELEVLSDEEREQLLVKWNETAAPYPQALCILGVGPDQRVAICMERSIELIVGLLGILKAGGAYVPLDPGYPVERLSYMLDDSAPAAVLSHGPARQVLESACAGSASRLSIIDLDEYEALYSGQSSENIDPRTLGLNSHHLAYIIYTSGSTGRPKGVMIEHANVNRLFAATESWYHFDHSDIWTLF